MSYISWTDIVKKLLPAHLRFQWVIDWLMSTLKGIRNVHDETRVLVDELDVKSDFNSSVLMLTQRLNDLFDPYHRNISLPQQNFNPAAAKGFTVNVPSYLQYGNIEELITEVIDYYVFFGVTYTFNYYSASPATTAASDYIDALISGGGASNTEIWSVINFYNRIRGHGIFSNLRRLHLMSRSNQSNGLMDFLNPVTTLTLAGSGTIDYDRFGFASDGSKYIQTSFVIDTSITDFNNYSWGIYISKDADEAAPLFEAGVIDGLKYSTFGINAVIEDIAQFINGNSSDFMNFSNPDGGKAAIYSMVADSGTARSFKDKILTSEKVMAASLKPALQKYLCCLALGTTPSLFSKSKIGTWYEYDGALSLTQRIALENAIIEYNNLNSR